MDYIIGCNYWASNAGTEMWNRFDENVIREDFRVLSENGIEYLRVFPNWRDFQPIVPLLGGHADVLEYRMEGDLFPTNPDYLDDQMLARFDRFCDLAEEFGMKLIVGLITGWMSGRVFIPAALYGKNLFEDPTCVLFEQRLIHGMVTRFKHKTAIYAWDLGNECNSMSVASCSAAAESWGLTVSNAIRAWDNTRPVISGMHYLTGGPIKQRPWSIKGQAEACDMLTTHPYPYFVPHSDRDRIGSMRTALHATCESKYYASVGDRPCLVEELGTLGPMICSNERAADFMRLNLFSNWANGSAGVMWWCANEQVMLDTPPYTYQTVELELGMRFRDGSPKPVLTETGRVASILKSFDFTLPTAEDDGVCILTHDQDMWGCAYMTYVLAKQAGLNLRFAFADGEIPDSKLYLIPSICKHRVMIRENFLKIQEKVRKNGAMLYLSVDFGFIPEFEALTGLRVTDSEKRTDSGTVTLNGETVAFTRSRRTYLESVGAEILAYDNVGNPAIAVHRLGAGKVAYVNFPLETMLLEKNDVTEENYYKVYQTLFADHINRHAVRTENPFIGITLHPRTDGSHYAVAINYSTDPQPLTPILQSGKHIGRVLYGSTDTVGGYDAAVFEVRS